MSKESNKYLELFEKSKLNISDYYFLVNGKYKDESDQWLVGLIKDYRSHISIQELKYRIGQKIPESLMNRLFIVHRLVTIFEALEERFVLINNLNALKQELFNQSTQLGDKYEYMVDPKKKLTFKSPNTDKQKYSLRSFVLSIWYRTKFGNEFSEIENSENKNKALQAFAKKNQEQFNSVTTFRKYYLDINERNINQKHLKEMLDYNLLDQNPKAKEKALSDVKQ